MAHDQPQHLRRLLTSLTAAGDEVFLHLSRGTPASCEVAAQSLPSVHLETRRARVHWGGYSMVEVALGLARRALDRGGFTHYALLSGTHYPLLPAEGIRDALASDPERNYITVRDLTDAAHARKFARLDQPVLERGLLGRGWSRRPVHLVNKFVLSRSLFTRQPDRVLNGDRPFVGNAWWLLNDETLRHVLAVIDGNPALVRLYRFSAQPLEGLVHTVLGNSSYGSLLRPTLTYEKWSQGMSPTILDEDAVSELVRSVRSTGESPDGQPALFARKFGDAQGALVDTIEQRLWDPSMV